MICFEVIMISYFVLQFLFTGGIQTSITERYLRFFLQLWVKLVLKPYRYQNMEPLIVWISQSVKYLDKSHTFIFMTEFFFEAFEGKVFYHVS